MWQYDQINLFNDIVVIDKFVVIFNAGVTMSSNYRWKTSWFRRYIFFLTSVMGLTWNPDVVGSAPQLCLQRTCFNAQNKLTQVELIPSNNEDIIFEEQRSYKKPKHAHSSCETSIAKDIMIR